MQAGWPGFDSQQGQDFSPHHRAPTGSVPHPASYPKVQEEISSWVKQQGLEASNSLPSSAEVKNAGAIPPLSHVFMT
jgi:hypothetical protein